MKKNTTDHLEFVHMQPQTSGFTLSAAPGAVDSSAPDANTLASQDTLLGVNALEHGSVLQNVGDDHKSNERAADKHLLQRRYSAIAPGLGHVCHAAVHVVFSLGQRAPIQLP